MYSGFPYDNTLYKGQQSQLGTGMNICAWVYAVTGKDKYAARTRELLSAYAQKYLGYPYHSANMGKRTDKPSNSGGQVMEQTLSESSWALNVCEAYDLIRLWEGMSEEDHQDIKNGLFIPLYKNINKHKTGRSNWQTYP